MGSESRWRDADTIAKLSIQYGAATIYSETPVAKLTSATDYRQISR